MPTIARVGFLSLQVWFLFAIFFFFYTCIADVMDAYAGLDWLDLPH